MSRFVATGFMLAAIGAVGWFHALAPSELDRRESRFVPHPEAARLASVGFNGLVANYYWMQAVQVVGAERTDPGKHADLLGRLVDVVTTVDPWVGHPYRFAAHWMVNDADQVRFANRILERGREHHPDDWRIPFYLGFNLFYYLNQTSAAADAIEEASLREGAPRYLQRLAARLRANAGQLESAAAFLRELIRNSEDPYARAGFEAALEEVKTERIARVLDAARDRYREARGRDIERVEDLASGRWAVLPGIPPDPYGQGWTLSEADGRIVSVKLGRRYEPWLHENDRKRRKIMEIEMESGGS